MSQLLDAHEWLQVGEIGLDFAKTEFSKEMQMDVFEKQLEMAVSGRLSPRVQSAVLGALRTGPRRDAQAHEEEVLWPEERRAAEARARLRASEDYNALVQRLEGNRAVACEAVGCLRLLFFLPSQVRGGIGSPSALKKWCGCSRWTSRDW